MLATSEEKTMAQLYLDTDQEIHGAPHTRREPVSGTDRLLSVITEFGPVGPAQWVLKEDGLYDLHPDVKFAREEAPPAE
jgi:hypothetical protein